MPKWIDLKDKTTGGKLKVAQIEGSTYLFIVGLSNNSPRWQAAVDRLRFASGGNGRFLIRKVAPGERPGPSDFRSVWPNAAIEEMPSSEYILDLGRGKSQASKQEEREIADETANARRLGRNAEGLEVYESDLGRFVWKERAGATYESATMRPAMVLRAPDAESMALCADGFIQGMVLGEVQHSEDLEAFLSAVNPGSPASPALRTKAHSAIDAAAVRHLTREFDTAQDAYGESVRLYELLPPYSGERRGDASMPVPLSVIAQRLLGDTTGKSVAIPHAFDGAAFSFLPKGTLVRAFRGHKDLSQEAEGLTEIAKQRSTVEWFDEFVPAREQGTDAVFFNADPIRDREGLRQDYRDALMASRALKDGGRAVLVLAADDSRRPGVISDESQRFFRTLASRFQVEEAFEIGAQLAQRVGTGVGLRVISLRNAPPAQDNAWLEAASIPVAHSWDEVKALVDEAIVREKVREAQSEAVNVDKATEVNRLQSPYLAFSKVGEARTMVPKNLQAPLQAALADIESINGPIDDFVSRELGFGDNTLGERFGPEQVDALGLIISRLKRNRASVLADETGIGKGRTLAGLCTWASKQGRPVVFITDRANLFSDMARDMRDIGEWGRFRPLITNSDGHIVETVKPVGQVETGEGDAAEDGPPKTNVLAKATPAAVMSAFLEANTPLEETGANIVFSTYSQISGEDNPKALWIKNQLEDALLIVDESHVAAGSDSNIARQISEMTNMAWNVVYSSATWAKTPRNLHIYARAFPETVNIASLTETMIRGGDGFSEVFSSMLARDGALVRREHDLSRLEFVFEVDTVNIERNRKIADLVSLVMGQISLVSGSLDKMMVRMSRTSLDALRAARDVMTAARGTAAAQAEMGNIFTSAFGAGTMLYQVQRRMNAALNIENTLRLALRSLEEGRKPVIVFDDTSEAFVKRALEETEVFDARGNVIRTDVVRTPTLRDLLRKVVTDLSTVKVSEVTYEEVMEARRAGRDLVAEVADEDRAQDLAQAEAVAAGAETDQVVEQADDVVGNQGAGDAPGGPEAPGAAGGEAADRIDVEQAVQQAAAGAPEAEGDAGRKRRRKKAPVRRIHFRDLPGLTDQQKRIFDEGIREIEACIDAVPSLPLSVADELHQRLRSAGLRTGEISGRSFMLEDAGQGRSNVRNRAKSKALVNKTVEGFNSFELDVVLINRSAATGLSLHASPRFRDHRRRELIECQPPENPTERVQLYGRVNRYDQLSTPRISISATGVPGETRHLMMQNKKLTAMNANVRSSRESHAVIGSVTDLLNPIGKEVCRQFLLDNPLYATRMAQDVKRIEDRTVDASSVFTRYISLLPVEQQDSLYEQVNQLFEEAVLKAEMAGDNPLKPKEFDWKARTVAEDVVFGLDHGGFGSAFDGPVYARALRYEQTLRPMKWATVCMAVAGARHRMLELGLATQIGTMLDEYRTPIISTSALSAKTVEQVGALARLAIPATTFPTVEEALKAPSDNPVKRGFARKIWLEENLHKMVPGARISLPAADELSRKAGATVPHIVIDVTPPKAGRESMLGQWKVSLVKAGHERPVSYSLSSLMSEVKYINGFDNADGTRVEFSAYNPVIVGGDVVMNPHTRNNEWFVGSFDRAPSGRRVRSAAILTGNMYLASEFATQAKVGNSVLYTDDRGLSQRAILMDSRFSASSLRYMPIRVWITRAVERLMLEISGLTPDRVKVDEEGKEHHGDPACAQNSTAGFLMHTSFASAWANAQGRSAYTDAICVVPGEGIAMTVSNDQIPRLRTALSAAQKRIFEKDSKEAAARQQEGAQAVAATAAPAPAAGAGDAAGAEAVAADAQHGAPAPVTDGAAAADTQAPAAQTVNQADNPAPLEAAAAAVVEGRRGAGRRKKSSPAAVDPNHVVLSLTGGARRGARAPDERGGVGRSVGTLVLKADTPGKMRRAIRVLTEGSGLQLFVAPRTPLGELAKAVVREDLVRRLRAEIGDNPDRLAKLEAQIERMDSEAAVNQISFARVDLRSLQQEQQMELFEVNGEAVTAAEMAVLSGDGGGEPAAELDDELGEGDSAQVVEEEPPAAAPEPGLNVIERQRRAA